MRSSTRKTLGDWRIRRGVIIAPTKSAIGEITVRGACRLEQQVQMPHRDTQSGSRTRGRQAGFGQVLVDVAFYRFKPGLRGWLCWITCARRSAKRHQKPLKVPDQTQSFVKVIGRGFSTIWTRLTAGLF